MPLRSIALRALLSLVLVLNGTTAAAASVLMTWPQAEAAEVGNVVVEAETPCHAAADHGTHEAMLPEQSSPASARHPMPDCCKAGTCHCLHAGAQLAMPGTTAWGHPRKQSRVASVFFEGHSDPALPHLIRPPIG